MGEHGDVLHVLVAGFGIALIAFLAAPGVTHAFATVVLGKPASSEDAAGTYEDEDGKATEKSVREYSDIVARVVVWIGATAGLGVAIALAILSRDAESFSPSSGSLSAFSAWSDTAAWGLLYVQCGCLPLRHQYYRRFRLACYGLLSAIVLLLSILIRNGLPALYALSGEGLLLAVGVLCLVEILAVIIVAAAFASFPRRPDVYEGEQLVDQQWTVSLIGGLSFSWNRFLFNIAGQRQLEMSDLPNLSAATRSRNLNARYLAKGDKGRLWWLLVKYYSPALALQWSLTALMSALALFPQYALYHFLEKLETRTGPWTGDPTVWAWVAALGLSLLIQVCVGTTMSWFTTSQLTTPLNSLIQTLVFQKALRLHEVSSPPCEKPEDKAKDADGGKDDAKKEAPKPVNMRQSVVNHMKLDSSRLTIFGMYNYYFPLAIFKLVLAGSFLVTLLGWKSFAAGLTSALLLIPVSHLVSKKYSAIQFGLMRYRDGKAHLLTEALHGMRQIKFSALEKQWEKKILESRNEELKQYWKVSLLMCGVIFILNLSPVLLGCISLSVYAWEKGSNIRASEIFASLGIFDQLDEAVSLLPLLQVYMVECWTSCQRLEKFFSQSDKAPVSNEGSNIVFEKATVAWPKVDDQEIDLTDPEHTRSTLRNVSLEFPAGKLSVIAGKTGSGKSLLLASILGEVTLVSGTIEMPSPSDETESYVDQIPEEDWIIPALTSFVSQTPWIEGGTVKENIIFGLPFSESRYQKVMEACALEKDVELLVDGDETEVGPKGVTLSGGQRWRVALGRALYSRAGILVLDDVLSAVDAHVGRIIVDKALSGELAAGRTRLLATHHAEMCLPKAHYFVRLHEGQVEVAEPITSEELYLLVEQAMESSQPGPSSASTTIEAQEDQSKEPEDSGTKNGGPKKEKKKTDEETRESGRVKWRVYKAYINASRPLVFWLFGLLLLALAQAVNVGRTWTLKEMSQTASTESVREAGLYNTSVHQFVIERAGFRPEFVKDRSILFWMLIYVLFDLFQVVFQSMRHLCFFVLGQRASKRLFEAMTHALLYAPLRWVDAIPSGRILNRFTSDTFTMDRRLSQETGMFLGTSMGLMVIVATSLTVSRYVIICGIVLIFFYTYIAKIYITTAREVKRINSVSSSPIFDQFSSVLSGLSTIRAFRRTGFYMNRMYGLVDNSCKASWALALSGRWMGFRMGILGAIFVTVVAVAIALGGVDAALAGFSLTFALRYTGSLTALLQTMTSIELGFNACERVLEYAEIETEPEGGDDAPAGWPAEGRIEVEDLTVTYKDDLPAVLKNLNFTVKPGERIGVVGRTGAGKSTLAAVLFRLMDPKEGSIRIDNLDIAKLKLSQLRSRLAIIPQDPFLFSGTLRSNLDMDGQREDYDLLTALQRVHLIDPQTGDPARPSAYTPAGVVGEAGAEASESTPLLTNLDDTEEVQVQTQNIPDPTATMAAKIVSSAADPNPIPASAVAGDGTTTPAQSEETEVDSSNVFTNLSTPISTGGANLSQGQRQLVCLARALLGRPKIIVLDEATSAVDRGTDSAIQASLRAEFASGGCTVLVIAHRLSTVADFDRLLVLREGRVAEMGTPAELLRRGLELDREREKKKQGESSAADAAAEGEEGEGEEEEEEKDDGAGAFWELVQRSAEKEKLLEMILGEENEEEGLEQSGEEQVKK